MVKINRGLEALPHVEQNVYRGINMVPIDTVARWVRKWKNQEPIFLGPEDRPALTSATWDIEVAKTFFVIGAFSPSRHVPHLSVMFEIVQHRGVSIQSVSRSPGEHEVLLPSQSKFQIEDISPLSGFRQAVYVKVRGLSAL